MTPSRYALREGAGRWEKRLGDQQKQGFFGCDPILGELGGERLGGHEGRVPHVYRIVDVDLVADDGTDLRKHLKRGQGVKSRIVTSRWQCSRGGCVSQRVLDALTASTWMVFRQDLEPVAGRDDRP